MDGVTRSSQTSTALVAATMVRTISAPIKKRRLSTVSARAPAGRANRNIGRLPATWTKETVSGSGSRLVISHPDAALYIQVPTFATTSAIHMTVNAVWRNGAHAECSCSVERATCLVLEVILEATVSAVARPATLCPIASGDGRDRGP